jgi:hypothetical protein
MIRVCAGSLAVRSLTSRWTMDAENQDRKPRRVLIGHDGSEA